MYWAGNPSYGTNSSRSLGLSILPGEKHEKNCESGIVIKDKSSRQWYFCWSINALYKQPSSVYYHWYCMFHNNWLYVSMHRINKGVFHVKVTKLLQRNNNSDPHQPNYPKLSILFLWINWTTPSLFRLNLQKCYQVSLKVKFRVSTLFSSHIVIKVSLVWKSFPRLPNKAW